MMIAGGSGNVGALAHMDSMPLPVVGPDAFVLIRATVAAKKVRVAFAVAQTESLPKFMLSVAPSEP